MTDSNMAGSDFDLFLDRFFDGDVFFSVSASDNSSSVPDPLGDHGEDLFASACRGSSPSTGCSESLSSLAVNHSLPLQNDVFRCSILRCSFRTSAWETIVHHRESKHGRSTLCRRFSCCEICGLVYGRKHVRDRHVRTSHRVAFEIYCPDCLSVAPFKRNDCYVRHRRNIHSEKVGRVRRHLVSPPPGHMGPSSSSTASEKLPSHRFLFAPGSAGSELPSISPLSLDVESSLYDASFDLDFSGYMDTPSGDTCVLQPGIVC